MLHLSSKVGIVLSLLSINIDAAELKLDKVVRQTGHAHNDLLIVSY